MLSVLLATLALAVPSVDEPLRTGAAAPDEAAVVIGLEDYAFVADVPYARRDAEAVYQLLVYTRGVPADRVQLLTSGGREQVVAALQRAAEQASAGQTVWVYFAGHGAAAASTGARILLGDDVRQDPAAFEARAVSLSEIREILSEERLVFVADACYSGLGRSGEELVAGKRFAVPVQAIAPAAETLEWFAASGDQLSGPLEAAQHGAFTYYMLGALRGWADGELDGSPDGEVTAAEASAYVRRELEVAQVHDQTPELVVADPSAWVLSTGPLEARPEIGTVATPGPALVVATPGAIQAADHAAVTAFLQETVDRCATENLITDGTGATWYVSFLVKDDVVKLRNITDMEPEPVDGALPADPQPGIYGRYTCIRQAIKAQPFSASGKVKVRRTLNISAP